MPLQTFTIPALPAAPSHRFTLTTPPLKRRSISPNPQPKPTKPSRTIPLSTVQTIKSLYCSGQHKSVISAVSSLHLDSYFTTKPSRKPLTKQQKLTIATLFFLAGESRRELAFRQRRYLSDRRSNRPGSSSSADSEDRVSGGFAITETQRQAREHLERAKGAFENAVNMVTNDDGEKMDEDEMDWVEKVKWERVEKAAAEFVACVKDKLRDVDEELSLGGRKGWRQRRQNGEIMG